MRPSGGIVLFIVFLVLKRGVALGRGCFLNACVGRVWGTQKLNTRPKGAPGRSSEPFPHRAWRPPGLGAATALNCTPFTPQSRDLRGPSVQRGPCHGSCDKGEIGDGGEGGQIQKGTSGALPLRPSLTPRVPYSSAWALCAARLAPLWSLGAFWLLSKSRRATGCGCGYGCRWRCGFCHHFAWLMQTPP